MSDTIEPALTAEEWADNTSARSDWFVTPYHDTPFMSWFESNHGSYLEVSQHALAALALHEQPFGFTREDVALLLSLAHGNPPEFGRSYLEDGEDAQLRSLAARIAALLPPEAS